MAKKSARFDPSFLGGYMEKQKNWKRKGKKAGHGGEFNIHAPLAELNRMTKSVINPPAAQPAPTKPTAPELNLTNLTELPSWAAAILSTDSEIAHLVCVKKSEHQSPHKTRLAQGIKNPKQLTDTKLAEHWLQVRLFYTIEKKYPKIYHLVFAIPNGGYRTPKAAATMKYEGQKSGVPDVFFPIPRGAYHGFFLEVKTDKGRPSKDQLERIKLYQEQGYYVAVGKGFNECIALINAYFELPPFDNKTILHENTMK